MKYKCREQGLLEGRGQKTTKVPGPTILLIYFIPVGVNVVMPNRWRTYIPSGELGNVPGILLPVPSER